METIERELAGKTPKTSPTRPALSLSWKCRRNTPATGHMSAMYVLGRDVCMKRTWSRAGRGDVGDLVASLPSSVSPAFADTPVRSNTNSRPGSGKAWWTRIRQTSSVLEPTNTCAENASVCNLHTEVLVRNSHSVHDGCADTSSHKGKHTMHTAWEAKKGTRLPTKRDRASMHPSVRPSIHPRTQPSTWAIAEVMCPVERHRCRPLLPPPSFFLKQVGASMDMFPF